MQRRMLRILAACGLLAAFVPMLSIQPALAAGVVGAGSPASCTEAAFNAALAGGGLVTFNCGPAPHTINLTTTNVIANNTQIDGGGQIVLNMNANDRHFYVAPPATLRLASIRLDAGEIDGDGGIIRNDGTVIANDVVFGGGFAAGSQGLDGFGGAIRNDGTLFVTDSTFTTNRSRACGGALYNIGTATISGDTVFIANLSDTSDGGGICNAGGAVHIETGATFDSNQAQDGGAIANVNGGTMTINGATFDDHNDALSDGGAIYNINNAGIGNVTLINSTISQSHAGDEGGGIWNSGNMVVTSSEIRGSEAISGSGGAIFNANAGAITISRSTFESNSSGYRGGALRNGGTATIETSTFSDNSASNQGGAIVNHETMFVNNSTIAFNNSGLAGGGIRNAPAGTLTMTNTIVANNSSGGDCSNSGAFNSGDYNLDSDTTCPIGMANDISGGNANLQALGDNGGMTSTHLPGPGSDAIDNGPGACASPDQRGEVRPQNGVCDIGAVEIVPPADVCYNLYTSILQQPIGGECNGPYLQKVVFEDNGPHYLCANLYTGQLSYSYTPTCAPYNLPAIVMPDAAPLAVCLNVYTGRYRLPPGAQPCSAGEFSMVLQ